MSDHSPEPWEARCFGNVGADNVRSLGGSTAGPGHLVALVVSQQKRKAADARRIAACVNLLAGVPTDVIELASSAEPICQDVGQVITTWVKENLHFWDAFAGRAASDRQVFVEMYGREPQVREVR